MKWRLKPTAQNRTKRIVLRSIFRVRIGENHKPYREGRKIGILWLPTRPLMKWRLNNTAQRRTKRTVQAFED